jgi:hypothetical protein
VPLSGPPPWVIDGYELHTHPDLHERLLQVAVALPRGCEAALFGCPVLAVRGVVFAATLGTSFLGVRLAGDDVPLALELGGQSWSNAGDDWVSFDAWNIDVPTRTWIGDLSYWCERAYHRALDLAA